MTPDRSPTPPSSGVAGAKGSAARAYESRLHPQAAAVLDLMDVKGPKAVERCSSPTEARAFRTASYPAPIPFPGEIREVDAAGVRARLYRTATAGVPGLLVYFHGGGWVTGDLDSHDNLCRSLASRSEQAVLSVDYRLAPEFPFPVGLEDSGRATAWAIEHAESIGCDPGRVAVGGDSSGGNIAAVVAQTALGARIKLQLLLYPVIDARRLSRSHTDFVDARPLSAAGMSWFVNHYTRLSPDAVTDPRVSPGLAQDQVLRLTPSAFVLTAGIDPLRDEGDSYARRLAELGVPTTHVCYFDMPHGFLSMLDSLDDARSAHAMLAEAIKSKLGGDERQRDQNSNSTN